MHTLSAILLAAGDGTRMKSKHPKVLCQVAGKPMIAWVLDACGAAGVGDLCVVLGAGADEVRPLLPERAAVAMQTERRGTGHAVMQCIPFLEAHRADTILLVYGDVPFLDPAMLREAHAAHLSSGAAATVLTATLPDPTGYGRIVRDAAGEFAAIVEELDADEATRAIGEINSGIYLFAAGALLEVLPSLTPQNQKGEYYITDAIGLLRAAGRPVRTFRAPVETTLGANDRAGLLRLSDIAYDRIRRRHLANGVEIVSSDGVLIGPDVEIGRDTRILPGTILRGHTRIGEDCVLGPNSLIEDSEIGDGCTVNATQIYQSVLEAGVKIGPFSHVRPNSRLCAGAKIGDFVEIKNSTVGEKTAVAHLTYVGDSDVGARVNFGCGVVTVNYDGVKKYRTTIGDDVFIGCNTNLIAPVSLGYGAYTAAGSTITRDVPAGALAIERGELRLKAGWAARKLAARRKK